MSSQCNRSIFSKRLTRRSQFGFTLVELLVVIGIIALLISVLLPALSKVQGAARSLQCQSNLRSLGQAINLYANTNKKGSLPYGFTHYLRPNGNDIYVNWGTLLMWAMDPKLDFESDTAYLSTNTSKIRQALFCPEVFSTSTNYLKIEVVHYASHPRLMPQYEPTKTSDTLFVDRYHNYVKLGNALVTYGPNGSGGGMLLQPYQLSKIKSPSEIALIFDGSLVPETALGNPSTGSNSDVLVPASYSPVANSIDGSRFFTSYNQLTTDFKMIAASGSPDSSTPKMGDPLDLTPQGSGATPSSFNRDVITNASNIRFRHRKNTQTNVLFVDGHVQGFTIKNGNNVGSMTMAQIKTLQSDLKKSNFYVNPNN